MSVPPNVLFYSKDCVHCRKFGQMLYKLPNIDSRFIKISVDVRNIKLPSYVKEVPTIVVFDDFKNKHILNGSKAFEWLNQFLEDASKIEITSYDEGTLALDIVDAEKDELIYKAIAKVDMKDMEYDKTEMFNYIIGEMLSSFPPQN